MLLVELFNSPLLRSSDLLSSFLFRWFHLRLCLKSVVVVLLVSFSILFFPSVILFVNRLIKVEMTPCLIYTDFVAQVKSSSGLFLCSWLTCGIAMACFWPRSGKQEWATQALSVIAACGPDLHAKSARCGPNLCRNNVAMWDCLYCSSDAMLGHLLDQIGGPILPRYSAPFTSFL